MSAGALLHSSCRALLGGAIDYAGLFPPAALELSQALANYLEYQDSADAWALGRFVVPLDRLAELEALLHQERSQLADRSGARRVPLTVLLGEGSEREVEAIEHFNGRALEHGAKVETVELRLIRGSEPDQPRTQLGLARPQPHYLEVPGGATAAAMLQAVLASGGFAKLRTGGTSSDAIPSPDVLLPWLEAAAALRLPFKATAGLHHPLRGSQPLTYADDSPRATMHGYLNLFLAAAVLWKGGSSDRARAALLEEAPESIRFEVASLVWRDVRLDVAAISSVRREFFHSFGSCSFRDPLDELAAGGWA